MAVQTQGTKLYTIDPANSALITVGCVTSIDGIDTAIEQVETTCLESSARTFIAGLATPGSASFGIQFDPDDASHVRPHQLKTAGTSLLWAIGFADGTAAPTVGTGVEFDPPTTRSWIIFEGFMNSYPFSFAQNSVVTSTVGIQVSGEPRVLPKA
jgi:hypothetical protein